MKIGNSDINLFFQQKASQNMIMKLITKLWPSLTPILLYIFWTYVVEKILLKKLLKKSNVIEGEKVVGEKSTVKDSPSTFSLQNRRFIIVLYSSFIIGIVSLIFFALSDINHKDTHYVPAKYENGKITPSQFRP